MTAPFTTKSQWDRNAEQFRTALEDKPNRASVTVVFPRILELFGNLEGKSILDFGCGSGRFSRALADKGAIVTAYDSSLRQLELAKEADEDRGIHYCNDLEAVSENSFHLAICFQVLVCNPLNDSLQIVKDIHRHLTSDGVAAFVNTNTEVVGRNYDGGYTKLPVSQFAGAPYDRHFSTSKGDFDVVDYWYSPADLKGLLESARFDVVREETLVEYFMLHMARKS